MLSSPANRRFWRLAGGCALGVWVTGVYTTALCSAQGEIVARIFEVRGKVVVEPADQARYLAAFGGNISTKDRLSLPDGSTLVVGWLSDGRFERLSGPVRAAVTAQSIEPPDAAKLVNAPSQATKRRLKNTPAVSPGAFTIARNSGRVPPQPQVTPIAGSMILEGPSQFTWPAVSNALGYQLVLYQGVDRIWSQTTMKPALKYGGQKLVDGLGYRWHVTAALAGNSKREVAQCEFTLASAPDRAEYAELNELAKSSEGFILALVASQFEQNNFFADAIRAYERLAEMFPESAAFHAALADLYDRSGNRKAAAASREKAASLGFKFQK